MWLGSRPDFARTFVSRRRALTARDDSYRRAGRRAQWCAVHLSTAIHRTKFDRMDAVSQGVARP